MSLHGTETVVLIDIFLSVRCKEQCCRLVGEGTVKPFQLNDNGQTSINILSKKPFLLNKQTTTKKLGNLVYEQS